MSKFFTLFIVLFATSSLFATTESFPFIGVTTSTQTIDLMSEVTDPPNRLENPASVDTTTLGIQYGVQTPDYRTMFTLEGNSDFQTIDVEVDYILFDELFGTPKVRPYVGATLGYIHYDEALITQYNENRISYNEENDINTTISVSDGYYGLNFGLLFYISDSIDLDVSYHYYFMDRLEPLDTMRGVRFSLHYFY